MAVRYNICIINPEGYSYSQSFIELAELLCFSIKDLGYGARVSVNDLSGEEVNIILGAHLIEPSSFDAIPHDSIIFNTEILGDGYEKWNSNLIQLSRKFEFWDYSRRNIEFLKNIGCGSAKHYCIGYHPKLNRIPKNKEKDIDILFYGAYSESRDRLIRNLKERFENVVWLFGVYRWERDDFIARSKVILNLHQYDTKLLELVRVHYLMNNEKAIVSQADPDTVIPEDYFGSMYFSPYEKIPEACEILLTSESQLQAYGNAALEVLKTIDAVAVVDELLRA